MPKEEVNHKEDPDLARLIKCCEHLIEHFDTVQIFCTNDSHVFNLGRGHFCTRYGQIKLWLDREDSKNMNMEEESE